MTYPQPNGKNEREKLHKKNIINSVCHTKWQLFVWNYVFVNTHILETTTYNYDWIQSGMVNRAVCHALMITLANTNYVLVQRFHKRDSIPLVTHNKKKTGCDRLSLESLSNTHTRQQASHSVGMHPVIIPNTRIYRRCASFHFIHISECYAHATHLLIRSAYFSHWLTSHFRLCEIAFQ